MHIPFYLWRSSLKAAYHAAFFPRTSHIPDRVHARIQCIADIIQTAQRDDKNNYDISKLVWEPILMIFITSSSHTVRILEHFIRCLRRHPNAHRLEMITSVWQGVLQTLPMPKRPVTFMVQWRRHWDNCVKRGSTFEWYKVLQLCSDFSSWTSAYLLEKEKKRPLITEWEHVQEVYEMNASKAWKFHQWLRSERFDELFQGWKHGEIPILEFHAALTHRPFYCVMMDT